MRAFTFFLPPPIPKIAVLKSPALIARRPLWRNMMTIGSVSSDALVAPKPSPNPTPNPQPQPAPSPSPTPSPSPGGTIDLYA